MRAAAFVLAVFIVVGAVVAIAVTAEQRYKRACVADCLYLKAFKEPAQCEWACTWAVK